MHPSPTGPVRASSATAVGAAILALLGAALAGFVCIYSISVTNYSNPVDVLPIVGEAIVFLLFSGGALALLAGRPIGPPLIVTGSAVAVAGVSVVSVRLAMFGYSAVQEAQGKPPPIGGDWSGVQAWGIGFLIAGLVIGVILPAIITAALALASSTKRWIQRDRTA